MSFIEKLYNHIKQHYADREFSHYDFKDFAIKHGQKPKQLSEFLARIHRYRDGEDRELLTLERTIPNPNKYVKRCEIKFYRLVPGSVYKQRNTHKSHVEEVLDERKKLASSKKIQDFTLKVLDHA
jgi:hypothetical protein